METVEASHNSLLTDPIPKLVRRLALPAAIGFFFNTMYNVVDTWIAGQISTDALAALSLSFPVFFIIIALSAGVGMGVTALIANQLGAGKTTIAKAYAVQAISYGLMLSITLSILGYVSSPYLFGVLGASGDYLAAALSYMQTIFIGSIFLSMTFILNGVLNAVGDTKSFRNVLIAGFFLNLLLSPWLAFGWFGFPVLGIYGIALATVITNALGCGYLALRVYQQSLLNNQTFFRDLSPQVHIFKDISLQGLPASFSMMTVALGAFVITYFVSRYGEAAVAGYGTALRIEQIVLIPGIGINTAVLTLIGQNNGAGKFERVKEVIKVGLTYSLILSSVATILILAGGAFLVKIFTNSPEVIAFSTTYLYFAAFLTWAYGIIFITDSALRGLKRPAFPLIVGVLRQAILPLPIFFLVVISYGLPITALWWSMLAIMWAAALASLVYMYYRVNQDGGPTTADNLDNNVSPVPHNASL